MQNPSNLSNQSQNSLNQYLESLAQYSDQEYFRQGNQMPVEAKKEIAQTLEKNIEQYLDGLSRKNPNGLVTIDFDFKKFGTQQQVIEDLFVSKLVEYQQNQKSFNEILDEGHSIPNELKIVVLESANLSEKSRSVLSENNIHSFDSAHFPSPPQQLAPEPIMDARSLPTSPAIQAATKLSPANQRLFNHLPAKAQQFYGKVLESYDPNLPANNQFNNNLKEQIELKLIKHHQMLTNKGYNIIESRFNAQNQGKTQGDDLSESQRYEKYFETLLKLHEKYPKEYSPHQMLREVDSFFDARNKIYNEEVIKNFSKQSPQGQSNVSLRDDLRGQQPRPPISHNQSGGLSPQLSPRLWSSRSPSPSGSSGLRSLGLVGRSSSPVRFPARPAVLSSVKEIIKDSSRARDQLWADARSIVARSSGSQGR